MLSGSTGHWNFLSLSFGSCSFTWLSFGYLHAGLSPLWWFLASFLCPWPILLLCTAPRLLSSVGAPLHTPLQLWGWPQELSAGPTSWRAVLWSAPFSKENFEVLPSLVPLLWQPSQQYFLLQSPCFGRASARIWKDDSLPPFPRRCSNIKGAFCNKTEPEKSFIKVSMSLTPCAQEQVFWLLHSYPCQHW